MGVINLPFPTLKFIVYRCLLVFVYSPSDERVINYFKFDAEHDQRVGVRVALEEKISQPHMFWNTGMLVYSNTKPSTVYHSLIVYTSILREIGDGGSSILYVHMIYKQWSEALIKQPVSALSLRTHPTP